jgi:hypothetical protein
MRETKKKVSSVTCKVSARGSTGSSDVNMTSDQLIIMQRQHDCCMLRMTTISQWGLPLVALVLAASGQIENSFVFFFLVSIIIQRVSNDML